MINRGQITHHMKDKPAKSHFSNNLFPRRKAGEGPRAIWIGNGLFSWVIENTHLEVVDNP